MTQDTSDQLKALVIDDSRQVRDFVIDYVLKPHGFGIDIATNGQEGLAKAISSAPDVILMDYEMPQLSGLEVLRKLRNEYHNKTPVILMTSHGSEEVAVEVFRLGVHDYLTKPFDPQDLLAAIEDALTVTRLQREKEALTRRVLDSNRRLTRHLEALNELSEVGKSITALVQPARLLERIVDAVLQVTRSEECALALIDPASGRLKTHLHKRRVSQPRQSAAGPAAAGNGLPLNLASESVLSVRLRVGKNTVGTLSIRKDIALNGQYSAHDQRLLQMLADYAAIAIQNMQLLRQFQRTKENEKQQIKTLFERYVAPTVVKQMLAQPDKMKLGGSRQTLTILFADVRGFSDFSTRMSPEVLVELLNQYMHVAASAILAQEGTLDKFMGDAVMAFFNAPLLQPDHPIRAVRAAWAMQRAVKKLHQGLPPSYRLSFGVGVGIGDAVVGNIGTAQMMNYTIIGDAVNRAKRLQELAQGGQILINQATYHLVQEYIEARSLGNRHLKGQPTSEMIYEVLRVE